jgi:hypothetical protein
MLSWQNFINLSSSVLEDLNYLARCGIQQNFSNSSLWYSCSVIIQFLHVTKFTFHGVGDGKTLAKLVHLDQFLRGGRGIVRPKAVVFSSFVVFLEMWVIAFIVYFFKDSKQRYGIMKNWTSTTIGIGKRDENLAQFWSDPHWNVLLGSIQAAAVGIDLRCAQNVYMMVRRKPFFQNCTSWWQLWC